MVQQFHQAKSKYNFGLLANYQARIIQPHLFTKHANLIPLFFRNLCLVIIVPTEVYLNRRGLIEYNLVFFRQGVQEILEVDASERSRQPDDSTSAPSIS